MDSLLNPRRHENRSPGKEFPKQKRICAPVLCPPLRPHEVALRHSTYVRSQEVSLEPHGKILRPLVEGKGETPQLVEVRLREDDHTKPSPSRSSRPIAASFTPQSREIRNIENYTTRVRDKNNKVAVPLPCTVSPSLKVSPKGFPYVLGRRTSEKKSLVHVAAKHKCGGVGISASWEDHHPASKSSSSASLPHQWDEKNDDEKSEGGSRASTQSHSHEFMLMMKNLNYASSSAFKPEAGEVTNAQRLPMMMTPEIKDRAAAELIPDVGMTSSCSPTRPREYLKNEEEPEVIEDEEAYWVTEEPYVSTKVSTVSMSPIQSNDGIMMIDAKVEELAVDRHRNTGSRIVSHEEDNTRPRNLPTTSALMLEDTRNRSATRVTDHIHYYMDEGGSNPHDSSRLEGSGIIKPAASIGQSDTQTVSSLCTELNRFLGSIKADEKEEFQVTRHTPEPKHTINDKLSSNEGVVMGLKEEFHGPRDWKSNNREQTSSASRPIIEKEFTLMDAHFSRSSQTRMEGKNLVNKDNTHEGDEGESSHSSAEIPNLVKKPGPVEPYDGGKEVKPGPVVGPSDSQTASSLGSECNKFLDNIDDYKEEEDQSQSRESKHARETMVKILAQSNLPGPDVKFHMLDSLGTNPLRRSESEHHIGTGNESDEEEEEEIWGDESSWQNHINVTSVSSSRLRRSSKEEVTPAGDDELHTGHDELHTGHDELHTGHDELHTGHDELHTGPNDKAMKGIPWSPSTSRIWEEKLRGSSDRFKGEAKKIPHMTLPALSSKLELDRFLEAINVSNSLDPRNAYNVTPSHSQDYGHTLPDSVLAFPNSSESNASLTIFSDAPASSPDAKGLRSSAPPLSSHTRSTGRKTSSEAKAQSLRNGSLGTTSKSNNYTEEESMHRPNVIYTRSAKANIFLESLTSGRRIVIQEAPTRGGGVRQQSPRLPQRAQARDRGDGGAHREEGCPHREVPRLAATSAPERNMRLRGQPRVISVPARRRVLVLETRPRSMDPRPMRHRSRSPLRFQIPEQKSGDGEEEKRRRREGVMGVVKPSEQFGVSMSDSDLSVDVVRDNISPSFPSSLGGPSKSGGILADEETESKIFSRIFSHPQGHDEEEVGLLGAPPSDIVDKWVLGPPSSADMSRDRYGQDGGKNRGKSKKPYRVFDEEMLMYDQSFSPTRVREEFFQKAGHFSPLVTNGVLEYRDAPPPLLGEQHMMHENATTTAATGSSHHSSPLPSLHNLASSDAEYTIASDKRTAGNGSVRSRTSHGNVSDFLETYADGVVPCDRGDVVSGPGSSQPFGAVDLSDDAMGLCPSSCSTKDSDHFIGVRENGGYTTYEDSSRIPQEERERKGEAGRDPVNSRKLAVGLRPVMVEERLLAMERDTAAILEEGDEMRESLQQLLHSERRRRELAERTLDEHMAQHDFHDMHCRKALQNIQGGGAVDKNEYVSTIHSRLEQVDRENTGLMKLIMEAEDKIVDANRKQAAAEERLRRVQTTNGEYTSQGYPDESIFELQRQVLQLEREKRALKAENEQKDRVAVLEHKLRLRDKDNQKKHDFLAHSSILSEEKSMQLERDLDECEREQHRLERKLSEPELRLAEVLVKLQKTEFEMQQVTLELDEHTTPNGRVKELEREIEHATRARQRVKDELDQAESDLLWWKNKADTLETERRLRDLMPRWPTSERFELERTVTRLETDNITLHSNALKAEARAQFILKQKDDIEEELETRNERVKLLTETERQYNELRKEHEMTLARIGNREKKWADIEKLLVEKHHKDKHDTCEEVKELQKKYTKCDKERAYLEVRLTEVEENTIEALVGKISEYEKETGILQMRIKELELLLDIAKEEALLRAQEMDHKDLLRERDTRITIETMEKKEIAHESAMAAQLLRMHERDRYIADLQDELERTKSVLTAITGGNIMEELLDDFEDEKLYIELCKSVGGGEKTGVEKEGDDTKEKEDENEEETQEGGEECPASEATQKGAQKETSTSSTPVLRHAHTDTCIVRPRTQKDEGEHYDDPKVHHEFKGKKTLKKTVSINLKEEGTNTTEQEADVEDEEKLMLRAQVQKLAIEKESLELDVEENNLKAQLMENKCKQMQEEGLKLVEQLHAHKSMILKPQRGRVGHGGTRPMAPIPEDEYDDGYDHGYDEMMREDDGGYDDGYDDTCGRAREADVHSDTELYAQRGGHPLDHHSNQFNHHNVHRTRGENAPLGQTLPFSTADELIRKLMEMESRLQHITDENRALRSGVSPAQYTSGSTDNSNGNLIKFLPPPMYGPDDTIGENSLLRAHHEGELHHVKEVHHDQIWGKSSTSLMGSQPRTPSATSRVTGFFPNQMAGGTMRQSSSGMPEGHPLRGGSEQHGSSSPPAPRLTQEQIVWMSQQLGVSQEQIMRTVQVSYVAAAPAPAVPGGVSSSRPSAVSKAQPADNMIEGGSEERESPPSEGTRSVSRTSSSSSSRTQLDPLSATSLHQGRTSKMPHHHLRKKKSKQNVASGVTSIEFAIPSNKVRSSSRNTQGRLTGTRRSHRNKNTNPAKRSSSHHESSKSKSHHPQHQGSERGSVPSESLIPSHLISPIVDEDTSKEGSPVSSDEPSLMLVPAKMNSKSENDEPIQGDDTMRHAMFRVITEDLNPIQHKKSAAYRQAWQDGYNRNSLFNNEEADDKIEISLFPTLFAEDTLDSNLSTVSGRELLGHGVNLANATQRELEEWDKAKRLLQFEAGESIKELFDEEIAQALDGYKAMYAELPELEEYLSKADVPPGKPQSYNFTSLKFEVRRKMLLLAMTAVFKMELKLRVTALTHVLENVVIDPHLQADLDSILTDLLTKIRKELVSVKQSMIFSGEKNRLMDAYQIMAIRVTHIKSMLETAPLGDIPDNLRTSFSYLLDKGDFAELESMPLHKSARLGRHDLLEFLLQHSGSQALGDVDELQQTPFDHAYDRGHYLIMFALVEAGSEITSKRRPVKRPSRIEVPPEYVGYLKTADTQGLSLMPSSAGSSLLHWAARENAKDLCAYLIYKQAPVNAEDNNGFTPLDHALASGSVETTMLMQARGAFPRALRKIDEVALMQRLPREINVITNHLNLIAWSKIKWEADFDLLHWSALRGREDLCFFFLLKNGDPQSMDTKGETPLTYAKRTGNMDAVMLLAYEIQYHIVESVSKKAQDPTSIGSSKKSKKRSTFLNDPDEENGESKKKKAPPKPLAQFDFLAARRGGGAKKTEEQGTPKNQNASFLERRGDTQR